MAKDKDELKQDVDDTIFQNPQGLINATLHNSLLKDIIDSSVQDAVEVPYNNADSGLAAETVKDAIDEVKDNVENVDLDGGTF